MNILNTAWALALLLAPFRCIVSAQKLRTEPLVDAVFSIINAGSDHDTAATASTAVVVRSAARLARALNVDKTRHVVIKEHLDLTGLPSLRRFAYEPLYVSDATLTISGDCDHPPDVELQHAWVKGMCLLKVQHTFLTTVGNAVTLQMMRLYIAPGRDAYDGATYNVLQLPNAKVWLTNVTLEGDGTESRGIAAPSTDIYASDSSFLAFRETSGCAISMDSPSAASSLHLVNCTFSDNDATLYGSAIYLANAALRLHDCTFSRNGAKDVAARDAASTTIQSRPPISIYDVARSEAVPSSPLADAPSPASGDPDGGQEAEAASSPLLADVSRPIGELFAPAGAPEAFSADTAAAFAAAPVDVALSDASHPASASAAPAAAVGAGSVFLDGGDEELALIEEDLAEAMARLPATSPTAAAPTQALETREYDAGMGQPLLVAPVWVALLAALSSAVTL